MKSVIWVLVNSNNAKEARFIGDKILKSRLAACYSLMPKLLNKYYWPPKAGRFETNRGPLLVLETLPKNYVKILATVKKFHSDKLPFIGKLRIEDVSSDFYNWMLRETK